MHEYIMKNKLIRILADGTLYVDGKEVNWSDPLCAEVRSWLDERIEEWNKDDGQGPFGNRILEDLKSARAWLKVTA